MTICLKNKTKRTQTYTLSRNCEGQELAGGTVTQYVIRRDKHGTPRYRANKVYTPPTLTLRAGETRSGLPPQVMAVPAIKQALERGELVAHSHEAPATETPDPSPEAQSQPSPTSSRKRRRRSE